MVERITYPDKTDGVDTFTADNADEIRVKVNALGTAADCNTGTDVGNVPIIGVSGLLEASIIPGGGGGGGSGDVVGPASSSDGRVALFDSTTGKLLKQGAADQLLPTGGTTLYWMQMIDGVPTWVAPTALVTSISTLSGADRLDAVEIQGLSSSAQGANYATSLIAAFSITDGHFIKRDGDDLAGAALGTAAFLDAVPSGAPTAASSTAGAITLNYAGIAVIETTTTEAITTITFSNITAYTTVLWRVKNTTARNITFPAGTKITNGTLTYTGSANCTVNILIYNDNGTYEVVIGDALPVGA
jgi:hypothetical protein